MLDVDHRLQQGRYRIRQALGRGGMGTVYLAADRNLSDRLVAIKENADPDPEVQTQFQHEAAILARLTHPNLPRVTDYFIEPSGFQYLVMDYVLGEDLRQIAQKRGDPLPETEVLGWISKVMDALEHMHGWINPESGLASPIVHRDLKPSNIKVTPDNRVVLVDFGLAKYLSSEVTIVGARGATAGYSPPEQYSGGTDVRSDLYSLGATLYMLLTGQRPTDAIQLTTGEPLTPPRQLNPKISANTERVILQAMQKRPADRFQSVQQMRTALFGDATAYRTDDNAPTVIASSRNRSAPASDQSPPSRWRRGGLWALLLVLFLAMMLALWFDFSAQISKLRQALLPPSATQVALQGTLSPTPTPTATFVLSTATAGVSTSAVFSQSTPNLLPTPIAMGASAVPTETAPLSPSATDTPTPLPTERATPIPTDTVTALPSATDTPTALSLPPTERATPTATHTVTRQPTETEPATAFPTATSTATTKPADTITPQPTATDPPTALPTTTSTITAIPQPIATDTPSQPVPPTNTATPLPTLPPTAPPLLQPGEARLHALDEALYQYVPAGEFTMGSEEKNDKAAPVHTVDLDAFWIKQSEVSNAEYLRCVAATKCEDLLDNPYLHQPEYANYPVVLITWAQAAAYASAIGGRLPTEAEWEKAARGTLSLTYPWGNDPPSVSFVSQRIALMPVASFPAGASPYGVLDMAGNVKEWVADWHDPNYYRQSPSKNPLADKEENSPLRERVLRGGSYRSNAADLRSARRDTALPEGSFETVGFRLVLNQPTTP